ncbi:MAG TPA: galactose oxidase, partial [Flavobacterium alvei]|nr:galactose oxidase [Flavobacterium alvei]
YNNKIYVLGGKRVSTNGVFEYLDNKIEVFDPENQSIIIDNTNPHQAADFASFEYNGNLIVMGGSTKMNEDAVKLYSNKVHSYNINSGYWYELDNLPTAKETTGVLIKNKIYLVGGFNSKPLNTIESFDLITEKWTTEGELFKAVSRPAITNDGNLIYFFDNERIYTLDTNTRLLKEYQIDLPLQASKLFYSEDKLYLFGGYIENYYSKYPSPILISIDINEFKNTKPIRAKFL